jgi:hypothetical protein
VSWVGERTSERGTVPLNNARPDWLAPHFPQKDCKLRSRDPGFRLRCLWTLSFRKKLGDLVSFSRKKILNLEISSFLVSGLGFW